MFCEQLELGLRERVPELRPLESASELRLLALVWVSEQQVWEPELQQQARVLVSQQKVLQWLRLALVCAVLWCLGHWGEVMRRRLPQREPGA